MKQKKVNPRRRPATMADVNRAKKEAEAQAVKRAWAIMFSVLRDKEGYGQADLCRVWGEVEDLCDSIAKGYCNIADLQNALKQEEGVCLL